MAGEYFFKNCVQNVRPYVVIDGIRRRGIVTTNINSRIKGGLRWNEWDALRLKKLLIREKLFPIKWKEDINGNILVEFG